MMIFLSAMEEAAQWLVGLRKAGGPDLTEKAHVKLVHEAQELAKDPEDIEELADVVICVVGVMVRNGWLLHDVAGAVLDKVTKNRERSWAQQEDGSWQHT